MAPIAIDTPTSAETTKEDVASLKSRLLSKPDIILPPDRTLERYLKAGIDLSNGYPYYPPKPQYVQEVSKLRENLRDYVDPGARADPEKKALFGAAKEVKNLTPWIGTEIIGLQLKDLNDKQKDELALLVAERSVVFFRDQDISPQEQQQLGLYLGQGEIERHPQAPQVPGIGGGVSLIWEKSFKQHYKLVRNHRVPYGGAFGWHTDLVHEGRPHFWRRHMMGEVICLRRVINSVPPGYTHLHQDTVPEVGGDTLWASGYAAYDKLSPTFRKRLDGLNGIYRSAHKYKDEKNPDAEAQYVTRTHPLIRTHPVTGWKVLWINQSMTVGIEGLDKAESDAILNYLYGVYERSTDIQVRWHWTPGTSAIWDNRATIHTVAFDYGKGDGNAERHGTRVSSLAEKPYFDPNSKSKAEDLQLQGWVNTPDITTAY